MERQLLFQVFNRSFFVSFLNYVEEIYEKNYEEQYVKRRKVPKAMRSGLKLTKA